MWNMFVFISSLLLPSQLWTERLLVLTAICNPQRCKNTFISLLSAAIKTVSPISFWQLKTANQHTLKRWFTLRQYEVGFKQPKLYCEWSSGWKLCYFFFQTTRWLLQAKKCHLRASPSAIIILWNNVTRYLRGPLPTVQAVVVGHWWPQVLPVHRQHPPTQLHLVYQF